MIERFTFWLSVALRRELKLIILCCVLGAIGMGFYTWRSKPRYVAQTTLLLPLEDSASLGGLALATGQGPSPLEIIKEIVTSDRTKNELARQTDHSLMDIDKMLSASSDVPANSVTIEGEGPTPSEAIDFVQKAYKILDSTSSELSLSRSAEQAKNLKQTLDRIQGELPAKEQDAAKFLNSMKAPVDPSASVPGAEYVSEAKKLKVQLDGLDQQIAVARKTTRAALSKALELPTGIPGIEQLRTGLVSLRHDLHVAETTEGPQHPDVIRLKQQIAQSERDARTEIAKSVASVEGGSNKDIADLIAQRTLVDWQKQQADELAKDAVQQGLDLKHRATDADITRAEIMNLTQQYETARIAAETDRVRWSVLDPPHLKDYGVPINKHYGRSIFSGVLVGFVVGLILGTYRHRREVPTPMLAPALA